VNNPKIEVVDQAETYAAIPGETVKSKKKNLLVQKRSSRPHISEEKASILIRKV
jgi:hypothetical protein